MELFYDRYISQLLAALVVAGDSPHAPNAPAANTGVQLVVNAAKGWVGCALRVYKHERRLQQQRFTPPVARGFR